MRIPFLAFSLPFALASVLALAVVPSTPSRADAQEAPSPRLDGVDHAHPKALLTLGPRLGAGQRTLGIAKQLLAKGRTAQGTLSQIVRWVGRNLRTDTKKLDAWRTADQIVIDGTVSGEAERALMIGVFARAAGIPVAWVKTLPATWLRTQAALLPRARKTPNTPVGRTFLEVHVGGQWMLLDPVTARLHERYDPRARTLPAGHVAFDKGSDPYALVLSNRLRLWRGQVGAYLARLERPKEPWAGGRDLLAPWRIHITGRFGPATYAREAAKTLGYLVEVSFDAQWSEHLEAARGTTLIVTAGASGPNLPRNLWAHYLGADVAALYAAGKRPAKTWLKRTLSDGTRVILLNVFKYGPVELAVSEALEG